MEGGSKIEKIAKIEKWPAFFEELTCIEHLIFFAALRGIDVTKAYEHAEDECWFKDLFAQKQFLSQQREKVVNSLVQLGGETTLPTVLGIVEMEKHFQRYGLSLFVDESEVQYVHAEGRSVVIANSWEAILAIIDKAKLSNKMFTSPRTLSAGMKRRLWFVTSIIGDPAVVFLDEPTVGLDPMERQVRMRGTLMLCLIDHDELFYLGTMAFN